MQPTVQYDPVTRILSLSTSSNDRTVPWLTAGITYTVTIPVAPRGALNQGPVAIDGAVLEAPVKFAFLAGAPVPNADTNDRTMDFCNDVQPIFQNRCSGVICHLAPNGSRQPAMGLLLQTADGVENTAIGRVSQESNTGSHAGLGLPAARGFGVDMPIIDRTNPQQGNPGNSWLMYKLLIARTRPIDQGLDAGASACGVGTPLPGPALVQTPAFATPLADDERARLSEMVIGNQMPYPLNLADDQQTPVSVQDDESSTLPCTFEEMERIRAWIAQGAKTEQCPKCPQ